MMALLRSILGTLGLAPGWLRWRKIERPTPANSPGSTPSNKARRIVAAIAAKSPLLERFSVTGRDIDGRNSRIDGLEANLGVLGPIGSGADCRQGKDQQPYIEKMLLTKFKRQGID